MNELRDRKVVVAELDPPIGVTVAVRVSQLAIALAVGFGFGAWAERAERQEVTLGGEDSVDPDTLLIRRVIPASGMTGGDERGGVAAAARVPRAGVCFEPTTSEPAR